MEKTNIGHTSLQYVIMKASRCSIILTHKMCKNILNVDGQMLPPLEKYIWFLLVIKAKHYC